MILMIGPFLKLLRLTNTTGRRAVKERVDPLTKYDDSDFHARFRLSKLTVTIYCRTYVRQFVCRPFATLYDQYTAKITGNRYNYE